MLTDRTGHGRMVSFLLTGINISQIGSDSGGQRQEDAAVFLSYRGCIPERKGLWVLWN